MTKCPQKVKETKTKRTNVFHWTDFCAGLAGKFRQPVCRVHGGPQRARPGRGGKNLVTIFNDRGQVAK